MIFNRQVSLCAACRFFFPEEAAMTDVYRFADLNIRITSVYPDVHALCADYRAEGVPAFCVTTAEADMEKERVCAAQAAALSGVPASAYTDAMLETLAVYRKIAERLPAYDGLLFHGSAVAVDGAAYLFAAPCGTGKSTHARLWRELLGERAVMVNDDKPLIRFLDGQAVVFGTPWAGKHHLSRNIAVPLRALCVLERGADNRIERASARELFPALLRQIYRPADPGMLAKTLALTDRLAASVPLYRLFCNMERSAAELSYHTMKEG